MRVSALTLLALPALSAAQQFPLWDQAQDLFNKAKDYVSSAASVPIDAGASKVAEREVHPLTWDNWHDVLRHSGEQKPYNPPEAWMVYITGGNKTCRGMCDRMDRAWNESVALFAADVSAPHLASINCDEQELLCGSWAAGTGSIWFLLLPQPLPDQSPGPTHITIHNFNMSSVTNSEITRIHTRKEYLNTPRYEGALHPFDGWAAKTGLTVPMAWALWGLSKVPSWAMMVGMSFFSRQFISRRANQRAQGQGQAQGGTPSAGR